MDDYQRKKNKIIKIEQKGPKRYYIWKILSAMALIIIVILIGFTIILKNPKNLEEKTTNKEVGSPFQDNPASPTIDNEDEGIIDKIVNLFTEPGVSSGGGGGGGGGGSDTPYIPSSPGCYLEQIPYSIKNFIKQSECVEYNEEYCIEKQTNCSIEVYNLDQEISGIFEVEIILLKASDSQIIETIKKQSEIAPNSNKTFINTFITVSNDPEGNANQELTCNYKTTIIPTKEICD